jgi:RND family efflux transporter MFP subunit
MKKPLTLTILSLAGTPVVLAAFRVPPFGPGRADAAGNRRPADVAPVQLWTCGMHPQVVQDHPGTCPICHMRLTPMRAGGGGGGHDHGGPPAVVIDAAVVQNMGLRTAPVTRGPMVMSVRTVGTLEVPEPGLHDVNLRVGGWIEKLYANQEGQHVHRGEPLFDLYSPDLAVAGAELLAAQRAAQALGPAADGPERRSADGLVASARRRLALLDVSDADVDSIAHALVVPPTFTFRSPSDGAVVDKAVVEGSAVQAGAKLMRIEDHGSLWLDLQVCEDRMALVAVGQDVEATVEGCPGEAFHGTVTFIQPHVDHMSRTVVARATLSNADRLLRPGMYAAAAILTRPVGDAVQVPREAVIDTGTRQVAFVALAGGRFEPRDVHMGLTDDDGRVQVLDGLAPGETVVTSGQFLLDVESRTTEAIDRLRGGTTPELLTPARAAMPMAAPTHLSMPGMRSMPAEITERTTMGTDAAARPVLVVAYCPMKKAQWVQAGEALSNPYVGTAMPDCGEVRRKVAAPTLPSPVRPVVVAYLVVEKSLSADKLDPEAARSLRAAAEGLVDPERADLRRAALDVASANDLDVARSAFKALSEALIRAADADAAGGRP